MTHTPGPWYASRVLVADDGFELVTVGPFDTRERDDSNHYEDTIADVSGINHDAEGNGYLIAAAPELLASCRELHAACAALFRVIADATPSKADIQDCLVEEFAEAGIANGFGVRAAAAIAKAEGR